jgi:hypothetical protein
MKRISRTSTQREKVELEFDIFRGQVAACVSLVREVLAMRSMVKPIEMKNSTFLTRAGFTCLKFICRCALLQAASCSQRQPLYLRFPGQYNLGLRRGYVKGQIENILIPRCTHLNLSGKRYPESSTRPFDAVGTTRSVSRKPNSTPPAG